MGLLERLQLESDFDIEFTLPTRLQRWFGEYKGGSVEFVINNKYREPGGLDWDVVYKTRIFEKFARMERLANYMADRGNDVNFMISFLKFSINFKDINEAVWFRMNT